jgi:hypothetical protein
MTFRSPSRSGITNSPLTASPSISPMTFSHQCFPMKFSRSKVLNWVGPRLLRRSFPICVIAQPLFLRADPIGSSQAAGGLVRPCPTKTTQKVEFV